jgi:transposase-like protein
VFARGLHPQGRRPRACLGADSGISKSEVSRICADLDAEVSAFRDRSLAGQTFPYIFVDATYCKARFPRLEAMLRDSADELLAFTAFPPSHGKKLWSTNPLERLNKEVKRRTDVVGVFPNPEALLRLAGMLLLEQNDEMLLCPVKLPRRSSEGVGAA